MGLKSPWEFFCGGWGGSVANIIDIVTKAWNDLKPPKII